MHLLDLHPEKQLYLKKNIGSADQGIRFLLSMGLITLIILDIIPPGIFAIVAWLSGATIIITSFVAYSPFYALLGINSCQKNEVI